MMFSRQILLATAVAGLAMLASADRADAARFARGGAGCGPTGCAPATCAPAKCDPCVRSCDRPCRSSCCVPRPMKKITLKVCDPCCCDCVVNVPVCVPECVEGDPCVSSRCGLFGRGIVCYTWSCGYQVRVVLKKCGGVAVSYRG